MLNIIGINGLTIFVIVLPLQLLDMLYITKSLKSELLGNLGIYEISLS